MMRKKMWYNSAFNDFFPIVEEKKIILKNIESQATTNGFCLDYFSHFIFFVLHHDELIKLELQGFLRIVFLNALVIIRFLKQFCDDFFFEFFYVYLTKSLNWNSKDFCCFLKIISIVFTNRLFYIFIISGRYPSSLSTNKFTQVQLKLTAKIYTLITKNYKYRYICHNRANLREVRLIGLLNQLITLTKSRTRKINCATKSKLYTPFFRTDPF